MSLIIRTSIRYLFIGYSLLFCHALWSQHTNEIIAKIDVEKKLINVQQTFTYQNSSLDTISEVFFNDWNSSYASKNTPLAKRFSEEHKKSLHLANTKDRGITNIVGIIDREYNSLRWERLENYDLIKLQLNQAVLPQESVKLIITYTVKIPNAKFTGYGFYSDQSFYLRDWYLTPAVYEDGQWHLYSNKDLQDLYTGVCNSIINFVYPESYSINSNYQEIKTQNLQGDQWIKLVGNRKKGAEIYLNLQNEFKRIQLDNTLIITDIIPEALSDSISNKVVNKVYRYISSSLGEYPHDQLLITQKNSNRNPLYGLNQLPSFVRPYKEEFKLELNLLKTSLYTIFNESFFINPRKEQWVTDALVNYLMINYVEKFYPEMKLLGNLSDIFFVKRFHLAQIPFNDKYALLYNVTARKNLNQSLSTSNDSLIKFNNQIANKYKAGLGLAYLSSYLGEDQLDQCIRYFYDTYKKSEISASLFREVLESFTDQDIDWFFDQYVNTNTQINFSIKSAKIKGDSTQLLISSHKGNKLPISLFGLKKDSLVFKKWLPASVIGKPIVVNTSGVDRLALNYDNKIPESNPRDNWKSLKGWFSSNRKLKIQFYKDLEDPYYNQLFYVPRADFNIYDGLTTGLRIHNKSVLEKPFLFDLIPSYGLGSKTLVGYGKINYRKYFENKKLYYLNFRLGASSYHFTKLARYTTVVPSFSLGWRPEYLRQNKQSYLALRYVSVQRDYDKAEIEPNRPNYGVFNAFYGSREIDALNYFSWKLNSEVSNEFSKLSFEIETRKLFDNKQQLNSRVYVGTFLHNHTDDHYFSFALDRPTDYLFEYNYIGRSESDGLLSQQLIIAEGGFKSKLDNPYANQWIATANTSLNLWRWIEMYNDIGFIKNKGVQPELVYDFGVRLNLVTDYFELYFPMYSNKGWEVTSNNYASKIRFIVTLSPKTLTGLFKRSWF